MSAQSPSRQKAKVPPWIIWARSIGAISVLAGGFGLMVQPQFFWLSVVLVYSGLLLLGVDLYFEPQLHRAFKCIFGLAVVSVAVLFSLRIVFISSPINITYLVTNTEYEPDSIIGGIKWRPFYSELDVALANLTDGNFDDVNIVLRPDLPVAAISQLSNLSDVSFQDFYGGDVRGTAQLLGTNSPVVQLVFLATNSGYKVHCGRIPPKLSLQIVMAIVDFKPDNPNGSSLSITDM